MYKVPYDYYKVLTKVSQALCLECRQPDSKGHTAGAHSASSFSAVGAEKNSGGSSADFCWDIRYWELHQRSLSFDCTLILVLPIKL